MEDLIKQIKSNVDHPGELERLYRDNQLKFVEAFDQVYVEESESVVLKVAGRSKKPKRLYYCGPGGSGFNNRYHCLIRYFVQVIFIRNYPQPDRGIGRKSGSIY